jgi:hypothetical protein
MDFGTVPKGWLRAARNVPKEMRPLLLECVQPYRLQITAPSSPLSHVASHLQLPELFISPQSLAPMQAHLVSGGSG